MYEIKPINVTLSGEDYEKLCNLYERDRTKNNLFMEAITLNVLPPLPMALSKSKLEIDIDLDILGKIFGFFASDVIRVSIKTEEKVKKVPIKEDVS